MSDQQRLMWAAHKRAEIAERYGLPWSEDDGYQGSLTENDVLRRAFAAEKVLPGEERD